MKSNDTVDILICGAGAAGLALAIDLARRGVSFRLIDKLRAPFAGSRGKAIQPRTQEVFEDLGMINELFAEGSEYPLLRSHRDDGTVEDVREFPIEDATPQEPYRSALMVPQFRTETVMRAQLAAWGSAPHYAHALLGFEQDDDGVTARIEGPEGEVVLRSRYLVGADGGRSFVRQAIGVDFPGQTLGVRAIVADLLLDGLTRDAWHRFGEGDMSRQISFCPLPYNNLFQLQAPFIGDSEHDLTVAGLQAFVDDRVPAGTVTISHVAWASAYTMSARLADKYCAGHTFLVGDAAHIHPPTGGQGLNTSVQDSYNLAWKLAAVLAGASADLLDTYEEERRPIAAEMLGLSTGLLKQAGEGSMRRGREVQQLDLGYSWSSLSIATARTGPVVGGDRAPDARLASAGGQGQRLFDLFRGPHWTLIGYGPVAGQLAAARPGLHVHEVSQTGAYHDPDGAMAAAYGLVDGDLLLVRPDGYVAAIAGAAETRVLYDYLERRGL